MKKIILSIMVLLSAAICFSQSVVPIRGDTARVYKQGDSSFLKVDSFLIVTAQVIVGKQYLPIKKSISLLLNDSTRALRVNRMWSRLNIETPEHGMIIYEDSTNLFLRYEDSQWKDFGGSQRFGVSGEDDTPSQNRIVGFTSTYVFNARHLSSLTFDADSSNGAGVGYAFFGLNKFANTAQIGTGWRTGGTGQGFSWFQSKWNSGNTYSEISSHKNADANLSNYFRTYTDSLIIRLNGTAKLKAKNLLSGAGTHFLKYDTSTEEITIDEDGGGGGTNNANVGSGYRWLKPGTQEIKTAFNGNGILIDSSSNTDGLTFKVDTTVASATSVASNLRLQKIIDSLQFAGWGNQSVNNDYRYYADMSNSTLANYYFSGSGAGASAAVPTDAPFSGWLFGRKMETGTTNTGRVFGIPSIGLYTPIAIDNAYRFSCGSRVRFEDLSDVSETYGFFFGFGDDANVHTSIVDGVYFRYDYTDSSGKFIACSRSNSTVTEDATDITVAADTWYDLQITGIGGSFYFYINGVLKSTISTNIPTGTARQTSLVFSINKSVGTTNRIMYLQWLGYDIRNN